MLVYQSVHLNFDSFEEIWRSKIEINYVILFRDMYYLDAAMLSRCTYVNYSFYFSKDIHKLPLFMQLKLRTPSFHHIFS